LLKPFKRHREREMSQTINNIIIIYQNFFFFILNSINYSTEFV